jgi:hypothetical protein
MKIYFNRMGKTDYITVKYNDTNNLSRCMQTTKSFRIDKEDYMKNCIDFCNQINTLVFDIDPRIYKWVIDNNHPFIRKIRN